MSHSRYPSRFSFGSDIVFLYTSSSGDIAMQHQMNYHFYADDSQLYISFKTCCTNDADRGKTSMEACVRDIDLWMVRNRLKLSQGKTVNYSYFTVYKASSLNLKIILSKRVSVFVFLRCRIFIRRSHSSRLSVIVRSDSICFY